MEKRRLMAVKARQVNLSPSECSDRRSPATQSLVLYGDGRLPELGKKANFESGTSSQCLATAVETSKARAHVVTTSKAQTNVSTQTPSVYYDDASSELSGYSIDETDTLHQTEERPNRCIKCRCLRPLRQKYHLPRFYGDPMKWIEFKNIFWDSTTAYDIMPFENMIRLRSTIRGEARKGVTYILSSSRDPEEVIRRLDEEYGNPEVLFQCVLSKIRAHPKVRHSRREMLHFTAVVQDCESLLGDRAHVCLSNMEMCDEVIKKLPRYYKHLYGVFALQRNESSEVDLRESPSLSVIVEFLKKVPIFDVDD